MKIMHVVPFFTPLLGGSVMVPYYLTRELSKKGHDITIITTDFEFDPDFARSLEDFNISIFPFKCKLNLKMFLYSPDLKSYLREHLRNFDLIHMHNFRSYQNNIVSKYAVEYGIPYIIQAHGSVLPNFEKQLLKMAYDKIWGRKLLKNAANLIAVSQVEVKQYKAFGFEKNIIVIPNGLCVENYLNLPPKGKFKEEFDIQESKIVLYVGRVHKTKGLKFLIRAFSELTKELDDVILVIMGPDEGYKKELLRQITLLKIQDYVKFIGYRNPTSAYVDADVLIYPSPFEIFGLVPLEAIMCGTPSIVTADSGCAEVLGDNNMGLIVPYNEIIILKMKMKDVLLNWDLKFELVENGKRTVVSKYSWESIVNQVERLYRSI